MISTTPRVTPMRRRAAAGAIQHGAARAPAPAADFFRTGDDGRSP